MAASGTAGCLVSLDPDDEMFALPHNLQITKSIPHPGHPSQMPPRWGAVPSKEHQLEKRLTVVEGRGREWLEVGSRGRKWLLLPKGEMAGEATRSWGRGGKKESSETIQIDREYRSKILLQNQ